jgi:hypothetical protein
MDRTWKRSFMTGADPQGWPHGWRGWLVAAAVAAALTVVQLPPPAAAQEAGAFSIRIAETIAATARSEIALPIEIGPPETIPKGSFVTVRGLPPAIDLKDGHAVGPGWWAVPLSGLKSLTAEVPDGVSGRSEIVVSLIALDGRLLAQGRSALVIQPGRPGSAIATPPAQKAEPGATGLAQETPAAQTEEQRARAERLLARGEAYLAIGNIMGARDFFERAADAGLADAALRLAATYDPVVLRRLKTQGVAADVALARKWYERARTLGASDAAEALARLGE